jgi:hypothetical protein
MVKGKGMSGHKENSKIVNFLLNISLYYNQKLTRKSILS